MGWFETQTFIEAMGIRPGHEWEPFEGLATPPAELQRFLARVPFVQKGPRRLSAPVIPVPEALPTPWQPALSTQAGFGLLLNELARSETALAERLVTTSPDVTVSTNLGAWVNRRGLFARQELKDLFRAERIPSTFTWDFSQQGQHIELGIAEMNLFSLLSGLGLSHALFGERLLPIGTLYDPFIARGLDALNYACYQDARFILVATPSGVTLAPEGGAHQSVGTPLIGMAQDGLAAFEPAFVDELAVILRWAFDYLQKNGDGEPSERSWLRDETGGSVYLRLSTRVIDQPQRDVSPDLAHEIGWYSLPVPELVVDATAEIVARLPFLPDEASWIEALRKPVLMDTARARKQLGWKPGFDTQETLRQTVAGHRADLEAVTQRGE